MIVKFFRHSGKGDPAGAVKYVMTEDRSVVPEVAKGNPEITAGLCMANPHQLKYTSGVLSWEKGDQVSKEQEKKLMASFEKMAFPGLDESQYNILWVRHKDKDRHELHFVVPRLELTTMKSLNIKPPHQEERFDCWKNAANHEFGFTDPNDPRKSRPIRTKPYYGKKGERKQLIEEDLFVAYATGQITSREDLIGLIGKADHLSVGRVTTKSITVVDQDGQKHRLNGSIFEKGYIHEENVVPLDMEVKMHEYREKRSVNILKDKVRLNELIKKTAFSNKERFGEPAIEPAIVAPEDIVWSKNKDKEMEIAANGSRIRRRRYRAERIKEIAEDSERGKNQISGTIERARTRSTARKTIISGAIERVSTAIKHAQGAVAAFLNKVQNSRTQTRRGRQL
jgi:hypothetical protein